MRRRVSFGAQQLGIIGLRLCACSTRASPVVIRAVQQHGVGREALEGGWRGNATHCNCTQ